MGTPEPETPPIKFPAPRPDKKPVRLALPRRRLPIGTRSPFELSEASAAARESINAIVSATRLPGATGGSPEQAAELERTLRQLELSLADRERQIAEAEARLADFQRNLAEMEALIDAREKVLAATRKPAPLPSAAVSSEERAALNDLRLEIERQTVGLNEARQAQLEREQFLDESETKLFEKVQEHQEKEMELEQREEDLRARERRVREREAAIDPQAAAALNAEDEAARKRDEFNE